MSATEALRNLHGDVERSLDRQRAARDAFVERLAGVAGHREEQPMVGVSSIS